MTQRIDIHKHFAHEAIQNRHMRLIRLVPLIRSDGGHLHQGLTTGAIHRLCSRHPQHPCADLSLKKKPFIERYPGYTKRAPPLTRGGRVRTGDQTIASRTQQRPSNSRGGTHNLLVTGCVTSALRRGLCEQVSCEGPSRHQPLCEHPGHATVGPWPGRQEIVPFRVIRDSEGLSVKWTLICTVKSFLDETVLLPGPYNIGGRAT